MRPDTQVQTWYEIQKSLPKSRKRILEVLKRYERPLANYEIAEILEWPINRVTGRVRELADLNMIKDSGRKVVNPSSGKSCIGWEVVNCDERDQLELF